MDQRRSDVGQDVRDILETRNAISQKLEMLEHRLEETVEGTKTTVEEIVDRVKDAADDFVDRTKQTFDPTYQVHQHPWAMVGGAILVGYVLGTLESRMSSERGASGVYPYYPPNAPEEEGASIMSTRPSQPSQLSNLWQDISQEISGEIEHAKGALIEVGRSFIHEFFQQALPALGQALGGGHRDYRSSGSSHESRGNGPEFPRGV
jgi:ElaB/YqjD/DUF883 family membrane-anchored ribosome-binding protein